MARIDEVLVGREQREDNYRKWSERAVVVGYNSENQTYDIVVTTERLVGANKRTLNKTIRRVKSILDSTVRVFLPGEAITIGYLSDKREHPIILGLGDNVVQTPAKVTLGPTLNIEGETSLELTDDDDIGFVTPLPISISCELDAVVGITCSIDCTVTDPTIIFRASGGAGFYTWLATPPAGCSFRGVGGVGEPTPDGVNNSRFVIVGPDNPGGSSDDAFKKRFVLGDCKNQGPGPEPSVVCLGEVGTCATGAGPGLGRCCSLFTSDFFKIYDCNNDPNPSGCGSSGSPVPGAVVIGNINGSRDLLCANLLGWHVPATTACQAIIDGDINTSDIDDIRTPTQKASGCCPCELAFGGLVVTVSDAFGSQISQTVTVGIV